MNPERRSPFYQFNFHTCVDTNTDRDGFFTEPCTVLIHVYDGRLEFKGCLACSVLRVFVILECTKHSHQCIPNVFVNHAIVLEDDSNQLMVNEITYSFKVVVEKVYDLHRSASLTHIGESSDINKNNRPGQLTTSLSDDLRRICHLLYHVRWQEPRKLLVHFRVLFILGHENRVLDGNGSLIADSGNDRQVFYTKRSDGIV